MKNPSKAQKQSVRINLFGTGYRIIGYSLIVEEYKLLQKELLKNKIALQTVIFDRELIWEFFKKDNIRRWQDLNNLFHYDGLAIHPKNFIEIRVNGFKKLKIVTTDLIQDNLLFPLYNVVAIKSPVSPEGHNTIVATESEIGLTSCYKFQAIDFDISLLRFDIVSIPYINSSITLIDAISYDGKLLKVKKTDTLNSGNSVYIL